MQEHEFTSEQSLNVQDKDTKFFTQLQRVKDFLKSETASRFMVAVYTDVPIQNVCRYVGILNKCNSIAVIRKDKCRISGEYVEYLTTNPDLFPKSNQLNLF